MLVAFLPARDAGRGRRRQTKDLIAVLRSNASTHDKARACQELAQIGDKDAVPALAALGRRKARRLLADQGWKRSPIRAPTTRSAAALGKLHGDLLAGVVNSIGVRRDKEAEPVLEKLALDRSSGVADVAFAALGRIGSVDAINFLDRSLSADSAESRAAAADACLRCAAVGERLAGACSLVLQKGRWLCPLCVRGARRMFPSAANAAIEGEIAAAVEKIGPGVESSLELIVEQLKSNDFAAFSVAMRGGAAHAAPKRWGRCCWQNCRDSRPRPASAGDRRAGRPA